MHINMMLERVTRYLVSINDLTRLDLIRRCFYLKVCEKLSNEKMNEPAGWRRISIISVSHAVHTVGSETRLAIY